MLAYAGAAVLRTPTLVDWIVVGLLIVGLTILLTPLLLFDHCHDRPRRRPSVRLALGLVALSLVASFLPVHWLNLHVKGRFAHDVLHSWSVGTGADLRSYVIEYSHGGDVLTVLDARGKELFTIPFENSGQHIKTSVDGRWLVFASEQQGTIVYDRQGQQVSRLPGQTRAYDQGRFAQASCRKVLSDCTVQVMTITGEVLQDLQQVGLIDASTDEDTMDGNGGLPIELGLRVPDVGETESQILQVADGTLVPVLRANSMQTSPGHRLLTSYTGQQLELDGRSLPWPKESLGPGKALLDYSIWLDGSRVFLNVERRGAWVWQEGQWRALPSRPRKHGYRTLTDGRTWVDIDITRRTVNGIDLETGRTWSRKVSDFDEEFVQEPRDYRTQAEMDDKLLSAEVRYGTVALTYQSRSAMPTRPGATSVELLDALTGERLAKVSGPKETDFWRVRVLPDQRALVSRYKDRKDHGMVLG